MRRDFRRVRWAFAVIPLAAISLGLAAGLPVTVRAVPEFSMSQRKCEKWPVPVNCYEYQGRPIFGCFNTLCEAVDAGFSHCTRNLKFICD